MSTLFLAPTEPPMSPSPHHPAGGGSPRRRSPEALLNPSQASIALRVSPDELLELINAGDLPAYNLDGLIRFRPTEVRELALERGW